jgi:serine/threonine-protein kinase RsbW
MQITLALSLPRDAQTVPVARHIVRDAFKAVGVDDGCMADIQIALTEACTNVVDHSGPGDEYEVSVSMNDDVCTIRVIDTGHGFDSESLGAPSDPSAERGRGLELMRALVDSVRFVSKPEAGTIVHLEKSLEFTEGSLVNRL